jgi:hypothetical protein
VHGCLPTPSTASTCTTKRRGAGEPLLLVQGTTGHSLHWGERFLSALERDFEHLWRA